MNKQTLTIQCAAVWGDVRGKLDQTVELSDLTGYVLSIPFEGDSGGDVVFLGMCNHGCLGKIFLADISGHGSFLKNSAITFKNLLSKHINEVDNSTLLAGVNNETKLISKHGRFITAVSATFNRRKKELVYAYAGHPNIIRFNALQKAWNELKAEKKKRKGNFPLGIISDTEYVQDFTPVFPGDLLIFFTDGLVEEKNALKEPFGTERLLSLCRSTHDQSPESMKMIIMKAVTDFHSGKHFSDDLSLLIFKVL